MEDMCASLITHQLIDLFAALCMYKPNSMMPTHLGDTHAPLTQSQ
jgi:hypothetical protein